MKEWLLTPLSFSLTVSGNSPQAKKSTEEATYRCMKWMVEIIRSANCLDRHNSLKMYLRSTIKSSQVKVLVSGWRVPLMSRFADLLSESLSTSKTIPWPQDALLWCRAVHLLHPHWSQQTWSAHCWLLLQSKTCSHWAKTCILFILFCITSLYNNGKIYLRDVLISHQKYHWLFHQTMIFLFSRRKNLQMEITWRVFSRCRHTNAEATGSSS